jgi:hypothetical protein
MQKLQNKNKLSPSDRIRINVLNKYLFGSDVAEKLAQKAHEKRLQELQDKDSLSSREKKEKEKLEDLVYGGYQTSIQNCTEVDDNDLEDLEDLMEEEEEDLHLAKKEKAQPKNGKIFRNR